MRSLLSLFETKASLYIDLVVTNASFYDPLKSLELTAFPVIGI
jgi:hypothetical protein